MNLSDYFPPNCPPADAQETNRRVYRFVRTNPPTSSDFKSHKELFPTRNFGDEECKACGLSVYTNLDDARLAQRNIPGMAKRLLAQCDLEIQDGRIKATPAFSGESHHTWWKPPSLAIENRFSIVSNSINRNN